MTDKHSITSTRFTAVSCYNGYFAQAIVVMLPPLLFVTFRQQFSLTLAQIGLLTIANFVLQIVVDVIGARIVEHVSTRKLLFAAHACSAIGIFSLGVFPFILPPFTGILLSICISAVGGGLLEVLISPIIDSIPDDEQKAASMSLLHSFYCWGCVAVILLSTLYFACNLPWRYLPMLWSLVPLTGILLFALAPLFPLSGEEDSSFFTWFKKPQFWLLMLLMLCAGASEQAMGQWASYFAQMGLKLNKTVGDLLGPMAFSILMGVSRLMGAKKSDASISRRLICSAFGCVGGYLIAILAPHPAVSLLGCAFTGYAVGCMWPGTFSLAAEWFPKSGGMLFALLALGGDLGCAAGPGLVGFISDSAKAAGEFAGLKFGLTAAVAFPAAMLFILLFAKMHKAKR